MKKYSMHLKECFVHDQENREQKNNVESRGNRSKYSETSWCEETW